MHERRPNDNSAGSGVDWTAQRGAACYSGGGAQLKVFAPPPDSEVVPGAQAAADGVFSLAKPLKKGRGPTYSRPRARSLAHWLQYMARRGAQ